MLASLDMSTQALPSAWAPFHHRLFSTIWFATVASSIGGWMSSAASAWLMTSLRPDPVMVALVQAASTFPMFLLAIPAGALADIFDKRRFLLFGEVSITVTAIAFAAIAFFLFGSAYWALLPLLTHTQLSGGPSLYGALLGTIGASAVVGAILMPRTERAIGRNGIVTASSVGTAAALLLFGIANDWVLATVASIIAGASWIGAVASVNVSAQLDLPAWVRWRRMAV